jgi:hypothetical protein
MLELKRADIGLGRVVFDDEGVSHHHAIAHTESIRWDEIEDYRLAIELTYESNLLTMNVPVLGALLFASDAVNAYKGDHNLRFGMALTGHGRKVDFNWRFKDTMSGVVYVLHRIAKPFTAKARAQLQATGAATFGPLTLSRDEVRWNDFVLERDGVAAIELGEGPAPAMSMQVGSVVELRVRARGRDKPIGHARTEDIPNVCGALQIARDLGYPVTGAGMLEGFTAG